MGDVAADGLLHVGFGDGEVADHSEDEYAECNHDGPWFTSREAPEVDLASFAEVLIPVAEVTAPPGLGNPHLPPARFMGRAEQLQLTDPTAQPVAMTHISSPCPRTGVRFAVSRSSVSLGMCCPNRCGGKEIDPYRRLCSRSRVSAMMAGIHVSASAFSALPQRVVCTFPACDGDEGVRGR